LLQASAAIEFIEYLSTVVEQVVTPDSQYTPQQLAAALSQILPFNNLLPAQILDVISQHWAVESEEIRGSLSAVLQTLISANIVNTQLAIELVDRNILQDSGIISNAQVLATRSVRINTGLLYKQQKFNLLREENEGYGKLSHEFNLALSELPKGGSMDVSEITIKSDELLTVVNALIGYFELDPNRVLDNILDVCSQNLLSHARFLLHFLHHSPWAPTACASSTPFAYISAAEKRQRLDAIQNNFAGYYRAEMEKPGGSRLAAQLLGFKLRYFASAADSNEKSQTSPESLIFLIALLIKSGFIKLSDIYPYVNHLSVYANIFS
jgi:THO complex subunit 2